MKLLLLCLFLATLSCPVSGVTSLPACLQCYHYAEKSLPDLLNAVLNIGVIGQCKELCKYIRSPTQQAGCQLYCSRSGVNTFVSAVVNSDSDSIYFCELINECGFKTEGDAEIKRTQFNADPPGIDIVFDTINGTGAGEIQLEVIHSNALNYPVTDTTSGQHEYKISLNDHDYTSTESLQFPAGKHTINISICSCKCGSRHPHSQIYDSKHFTFTVPE